MPTAIAWQKVGNGEVNLCPDTGRRVKSDLVVHPVETVVGSKVEFVALAITQDIKDIATRPRYPQIKRQAAYRREAPIVLQ